MLDAPERGTAVAFDLIVKGVIAVAIITLVLSAVALVRAFRSDWRSPLWDEDDDSWDDLSPVPRDPSSDRDTWETVRDFLSAFADLDGD
jgi:hypothetical protein